jgi:hypothetical protein
MVQKIKTRRGAAFIWVLGEMFLSTLSGLVVRLQPGDSGTDDAEPRGSYQLLRRDMKN